MTAPCEHYAMVGPLWSQLERALQDAGGEGKSAEDMINSMKGRLPHQRIAALHELRRQRNALQHGSARPLPNPTWWDRTCRESLADLHALHTRGASEGGWSDALTKVAATGICGYMVLQSQQLTEIALIGALGYGAWRLFAGDK